MYFPLWNNKKAGYGNLLDGYSCSEMFHAGVHIHTYCMALQAFVGNVLMSIVSNIHKLYIEFE